jgi:hypothetical protein
MQKNVHFLKGAKRASRGGFILISAVFLMLALTFLLLKMISYSTENAQQVTNDYLQEQAELLAYGATEYAMLRISANAPSSCPTSYSLVSNNLFVIRTNISYVWAGAAPAGCASTLALVQAPQQNGTALVDVTVEINATKRAELGLYDAIRFHRRTLQKL